MTKLFPRIRRPLALGGLLAPLGSMLAALPAHAAGDEPAGGAAMSEVIIATVGMGALTAAVLALGIGHRTGRITWLGRLADASSRASGLPGWAALPSTVATVALLTALFGMYWDISLHIDVGRDAGPLANPAHYFILAGLFGIFTAGFLAMVLPLERPGGTAVRITDGWYAPLGGILILGCAAFSLIGFPLDDLWHRLFGQDVTLWGPTHLMLIGGAAMTLVGRAALLVEGVRAAPGVERERTWLIRAQSIGLAGGLLIGLSTFQAEFDFGVPQFRFIFQPVLIMIAAGVGLVAARVWAGPGAAIGAVAFFVAIRGLLALMVGPVLGETAPHVPLYIAEAAVVELIALRASTERPLVFGAWAGLGIGTVGLAAEWGWSHVWMPLAWPSSLLPEAAVLGLAAALAASVLGGWVGSRLRFAEPPRMRGSRVILPVAAAVLAGLIGYGLLTSPRESVTARVSVQEIDPAPARTVSATVAIDPANAAVDANWLTATAWQGGGLVVDRLERTGPGQYRTTEPIPVHGNWKALVRLHSGNAILGVPIFLPEDRAIPAAGVPASSTFTRAFVPDKQILQREAKESSGWLTLGAFGVVLMITMSLLTLLAWGLHRLAAAAPGGSATPPAAPPATKRAEPSPRRRPVRPGVPGTLDPSPPPTGGAV